jgi:hypothetical protein
MMTLAFLASSLVVANNFIFLKRENQSLQHKIETLASQIKDQDALIRLFPQPFAIVEIEKKTQKPYVKILSRKLVQILHDLPKTVFVNIHSYQGRNRQKGGPPQLDGLLDRIMLLSNSYQYSYFALPLTLRDVLKNSIWFQRSKKFNVAEGLMS